MKRASFSASLESELAATRARVAFDEYSTVGAWDLKLVSIALGDGFIIGDHTDLDAPV